MNHTLRFFVNGSYHEVARPVPTTTVLEFVREHLRLTGTKEGCAEGDCGACTTVVCELDGDGYRLRPVNACIQFLPTLDGKELLTVEGLRDDRGSLHPAQQAMIDCHGSQCGFCTPGFVMSLFALYKHNAAPDRGAIDQALSGNLCRCTGYRPIIKAAGQMYRYPPDKDAQLDFKRVPGPAGFKLTAGEQDLVQRLKSIQRTRTLDIDHGQRFIAPVTVQELARHIEADPDATILAGGTDVGLWHTKQYRPLPLIIYLGDVPELKQLEVTDKHVRVGAAVTLADAFDVLCAEIDGLREVTRRFASPPICNAGTLVGNVANGSPIGDSMPVLLCLGAELVLRKGARERRLPLNRFYLDYQHKALDPGEFVAALEVPRPEAGTVVRSYKIAKRFDQDISALCGAYALRMDGDTVADIAVGYGGMAAVPARAIHTEAAIKGGPWSRGVINNAIAELARDFQPIGDMRASDEYRARMAANLLLKFYLDTCGASPPRVFDLGAVTP